MTISSTNGTNVFYNAILNNYTKADTSMTRFDVLYRPACIHYTKHISQTDQSTNQINVLYRLQHCVKQLDKTVTSTSRISWSYNSVLETSTKIVASTNNIQAIYSRKLFA
jgi:hypothetical protein